MFWEDEMESDLLASKELIDLRAKRGLVSKKIGLLMGRSVINYFEVKKLRYEQIIIKEAISDLEDNLMEDLIA